MRVRLKLDLDFEGHHTFQWEPSNALESVEVPRAALERWTTEREAFEVARLRWRRVLEEIEEQLYRAERERSQGAAALATVSVGAAARPRKRGR